MRATIFCSDLFRTVGRSHIDREGAALGIFGHISSVPPSPEMAANHAQRLHRHDHFAAHPPCVPDRHGEGSRQTMGVPFHVYGMAMGQLRSKGLLSRRSPIGPSLGIACPPDQSLSVGPRTHRTKHASLHVLVERRMALYDFPYR